MEQVLVDDVLGTLVLFRVLMGLALLAVCLAVSGVYAILSFIVGRRTAEIGLRLALGARPGDVVRLIVADGLAYGLVGVALGMGSAWAVVRLTASQLSDVTPADPTTFVGSAVLLTSLVILASWVPARAAARVSPQRALQQ